MSVDMTVPQFIINSMNQAKQLRLQKEKQASDIEQQSAQTDLLKQQHEQQTKTFGDLLKHMQLQNDTQTQAMKTQQMQNEIGIRNLFMQGAIRPTGQTQIPLGQQLSDKMNASAFQSAPTFNIGGQDIQLPGAVDPQQHLASDANRESVIGSVQAKNAGLKAGAESEAQLPAALNLLSAKNRNDLGMMREKSSLDAQNEMAKLIQEGHNSAQVARIHGSYALEGDKIQAAAHIQGIRIGNEMRLDPDALNASFNAVQSGQQDINHLPDWQMKTAVTALYGKMGWVPPNEKHVEAVQNAAGVQSLIDQYLALAKQYSRDSPQGGLMTMATSGLSASELGSKLKGLQAQGGALATFFDKQNRKSDAEILRQGTGLFSPTSTIQENIDKIKSHEKTFNDTIKAGFSGMPDAQINDMLHRAKVSIFGGYGKEQSPGFDVSKASPTNDKGHKLNPEMSQRMGQAIYEDK